MIYFGVVNDDVFGIVGASIVLMSVGMVDGDAEAETDGVGIVGDRDFGGGDAV
jgi:hypothetical protein